MVLVFGSNGQLASSLKQTRLGSRAEFLGSNQVDFTDSRQIDAALRSRRPRLIINTSAYTHVDKAETDRDTCRLVNATAVEHIANWARDNDASVVHFSTDYVFAGTGEGLWDEGHEKAPLNWYGETKLEGERLLGESGCHAVTFRTSWVFSEYGSNFLKTMLRLGNSEEQIRVVADQRGSPTYAPDIASFLDRAIARVEAREISGTYNLSNEGTTTWHGFADYIFQRAQALGERLKIKSVAPIPSSQYPTPARRPLNGSLDLSRTRATFGEALPPWQDAVDRCLAKMVVPLEGN